MVNLCEIDHKVKFSDMIFLSDNMILTGIYSVYHISKLDLDNNNKVRLLTTVC